MGVPGLLRIFRKNTYGSPRSLVTQSREARGDEFLWGPPKSLRALGVQERKAKLGKSRGSGVKGKRSLAARRWRGEAGSGRGGP